LRVELDDPHHLFVSVLLQPLFQKLLLPLELRGAAAGKKDRDTRRKMWHEAKQLYDDLGLEVHRAFTTLRSGPGGRCCKASRGVQAAVLDPGLAVAVDDLSALKVLSYTGMLTIAMIIDRGHGLDLDHASCRRLLRSCIVAH
jgi:hypothetical protein